MLLIFEAGYVDIYHASLSVVFESSVFKKVKKIFLIVSIVDFRLQPLVGGGHREV